MKGDEGCKMRAIAYIDDVYLDERNIKRETNKRKGSLHFSHTQRIFRNSEQEMN